MKNLQSLYLSLSMLIMCSGCGIINNYDAKGLKNYFLKYIESEKIKIEEISWGMFPSSRQGYFLFKISADEFDNLKRALSLKQMVSPDDIRHIFSYYQNQLVSIKFNVKNPNYDPNNIDTWEEYPLLLPEVSIFYADPPLPPIKGNDRSSFKHLFYNKITGESCVLLEYPYG